MTCRYCKVALAPSRSFIDGEFCCDDHRRSFELENPSETPDIEPVPAALEILRRRFTPQPVEPAISEDDLVSEEILDETATADQEPEAEVDAEFVAPVEAYAEEDAVEPTEETLETAQAFEQTEDDAPPPDLIPPPETAAPHRWFQFSWNFRPSDLRLAALVLPVLAIIGVTGTVPTTTQIRHLAPQNLDQVQGQVQQVQRVVQVQWKNLNQTISDRAAVAYADDFRSGLDAWESRSSLTRSWSYDAAGFVKPGPLALFKPSIDLSDYRFEFLGEIDQKALGWAFRAADLNNYYAMKFVVEKPGPLPLVHIVRYAVIKGKEGPHVDKPLPLTVRPDMLYRIQVNARGSDFTIMAQGQVVDFWSDNRLTHGGVGFFSNRGESARLRWVEVSHQYDALGRLCAYLAPYGIEGRNGNIN